MALNFTDIESSAFTVLMRAATGSSRRERVTLALVTIAWPLTVALLSFGQVMNPGVDEIFAWRNGDLVNAAFGLSALSAIAAACRPTWRTATSLFVLASGWVYLGRAWAVWTGGTASGATGWAQFVGGTVWAAITIATLTFHLLHVALVLAARASGASGRDGRRDPR